MLDSRFISCIVVGALISLIIVLLMMNDKFNETSFNVIKANIIKEKCGIYSSDNGKFIIKNLLKESK